MEKPGTERGNEQNKVANRRIAEINERTTTVLPGRGMGHKVITIHSSNIRKQRGKQRGDQHAEKRLQMLKNFEFFPHYNSFSTPLNNLKWLSIY
jgi:hypothetical protein